MTSTAMKDQLHSLRLLGRTRGWSSDRLHKIAPSMNTDGIDHRRLEALADLLDELPRFDAKTVTGRPTTTLKYVDGRTMLTHFSLMAHGGGFGFIRFDRPRNGAIECYALTAYGVICWGWGATNGMESVATGRKRAELEQVLHAKPCIGVGREVELPFDADAKDVAFALRRWLKHGNVVEAWRETAVEMAKPKSTPSLSVVRKAQAAQRVKQAATEVIVPKAETLDDPMGALAESQSRIAQAEATLESARKAHRDVQAAAAASLLRMGDMTPKAVFAAVYGEE